MLSQPALGSKIMFGNQSMIRSEFEKEHMGKVRSPYCTDTNNKLHRALNRWSILKNILNRQFQAYVSWEGSNVNEKVKDRLRTSQWEIILQLSHIHIEGVTVIWYWCSRWIFSRDKWRYKFIHQIYFSVGFFHYSITIHPYNYIIILSLIFFRVWIGEFQSLSSVKNCPISKHWFSKFCCFSGLVI